MTASEVDVIAMVALVVVIEVPACAEGLVLVVVVVVVFGCGVVVVVVAPACVEVSGGRSAEATQDGGLQKRLRRELKEGET